MRSVIRRRRPALAPRSAIWLSSYPDASCSEGLCGGSDSSSCSGRGRSSRNQPDTAERAQPLFSRRQSGAARGGGGPAPTGRRATRSWSRLGQGDHALREQRPGESCPKPWRKHRAQPFLSWSLSSPRSTIWMAASRSMPSLKAENQLLLLSIS